MCVQFAQVYCLNTHFLQNKMLTYKEHCHVLFKKRHWNQAQRIISNWFEPEFQHFLYHFSISDLRLAIVLPTVVGRICRRGIAKERSILPARLTEKESQVWNPDFALIESMPPLLLDRASREHGSEEDRVSSSCHAWWRPPGLWNCNSILCYHGLPSICLSGPSRR